MLFEGGYSGYCRGRKRFSVTAINSWAKGTFERCRMDERLIIKTTLDTSLALASSKFLIRSTFGNYIRQFASLSALCVLLQGGLTEREENFLLNVSWCCKQVTSLRSSTLT